MLPVISLIVSAFIFSWITIIWKKGRENDENVISSLSMFIFSIPLFFISWFFTTKYYTFNFSYEYLFYVIVWIIPVFILNFLNNYLIKYKSLTEIRSLRLGFGILFAIISDLFYFKTTYNWLTLVSIILFFISSYLIEKNSLQKIKFKKSLFIIGIIALCGVVEDSIYKKGLMFQETIFFHIIICQILLFTLFSIFGIKHLIKDVKSKKIQIKDIFLVSGLIYVYTILEAYSIKNLPIAVITLGNLVPVIVYSLFDVKTKEIILNKYSISAFCMLIVGIIFLSL